MMEEQARSTLGKDPIPGLQKHGASKDYIVKSNANREQIRRNNALVALHSANVQNPKKLTKFEREKLGNEQRVREIHRKISEHSAVIQSRKIDHLQAFEHIDLQERLQEHRQRYQRNVSSVPGSYLRDKLQGPRMDLPDHDLPARLRAASAPGQDHRESESDHVAGDG